MYDDTRFKSPHGSFSDLIQKSTALELVGDCRGKHILEIGSGTGRFTKELVKHGASVVCVDLSRQMHGHARSAIHNNSVEYFVMSGLHLGFESETFDVCLTINMMSHIKNESLLFAEVKRVLKKSGFFVANFPNMSGLYFPIGELVNIFKRSLQAPVYSKWYTVRGLFSSFKNSGLTPIQILGHMIIPEKYCPTALFEVLKNLDRSLSGSVFTILCGDLFVKLQPLEMK